ncbi:unnamed protein product [Wuchereria bancrofti]|uniref:Uncharacterized protein n=1 Tax=Wuchereria bancrofti TaxID=6293 RepID=A0A3P7DRN9_WUCBA|nr:unnamed protein product [Wuchereria bancrofti]
MIGPNIRYAPVYNKGYNKSYGFSVWFFTSVLIRIYANIITSAFSNAYKEDAKAVVVVVQLKARNWVGLRGQLVSHLRSANTTQLTVGHWEMW